MEKPSVVEDLSLPIPAILALEFDCGDLGERVTIREYLITLLDTLWEEEDGFSGKRPFGNSGWKYDLYQPLVAAGVVTGSLMESGAIDECDTARADAVIRACIQSLRSMP